MGSSNGTTPQHSNGGTSDLQSPRSAEPPKEAATSQQQAPPSIFDLSAWRQNVQSPWPWTKAANQAGALGKPVGGEAGGFYVTNDKMNGRRAYMKPLKAATTPGHVRAVREKLASDLAFDLGISVPPVLLHARQPKPAGEEEFTCVSLVLHPMEWAWELLQTVIMDGKPEEIRNIVMPAMPKAAAGALALNTWVEQIDHGGRDGRGHPSNILYGYPTNKPADGHFIFLDYAWSLGFPHETYAPDGWAKGGWKKRLVHPPFPAYMLRFIDLAELERHVSAIEKYDDKDIEKLVKSMPRTHLAEEQGDLIIEGLIGRKGLVRQLIDPVLNKGKKT